VKDGIEKCHSEPFAFVTLSETKGLVFMLRVNSAKNLKKRFFVTSFLRMTNREAPSE
jgi:hypothetical protein